MITFSLQDVQNLVLAVSLWPPLTEPAQSGFPAEGRAHGGLWSGGDTRPGSSVHRGPAAFVGFQGLPSS